MILDLKILLLPRFGNNNFLPKSKAVILNISLLRVFKYNFSNKYIE